MSTPTTPGPSRRRRIAGERRPSRTESATTTQPQAEPAAETSAPVPSPTKAVRPPKPPKVPRKPKPGKQQEEPSRSRLTAWWGSRTSLLVLGALLVVVVLLTGLLALGLLGNKSVEEVREADATERAGRTASATAERAAEAILAYDHASLDADQTTAESFMTEKFAAQYAATFEKVVKPAAEESKATVTSEVQGSSVVRAAPDRVRVLVYVDQRTVSTANQGPQVALNRVEMQLVERDGTWLVDNITSY